MSVKRPLNSAYIHIPFCTDKCYYCNFISLVNKNKYEDLYLNELKNEISNELDLLKPCLNTVYIGGGTPSIIDIHYYNKLLSIIYEKATVKENPEITMEVNPGTVDINYLRSIKSLGINRLSIGIQSFNDEILKSLNRKHSRDEAIQAIELARKAGFENISIDLMYGLPGQDLSIWQETLSQTAKLDIEHISAYGLKIEEGTRFFKTLPAILPAEEINAEMYIKAVEFLTEHGFKHYEISNFAKPDYPSRHNLAYWKNQEYFGFGLGAHGYVNGSRYSNFCNMEKYLENPDKKEQSHEVSKQEMIEEAIFLVLRLTEGINIDKFKEDYGINLIENYKEIIQKYVSNGFMQVTQENLKLTIEGILISNTILSDFLE